MHQLNYSIQMYQEIVSGTSIGVFDIFLSKQFFCMTVCDSLKNNITPRRLIPPLWLGKNQELKLTPRGATTMMPNKHIETIRFLICRNCFWCASLINWRSESDKEIARHSSMPKANKCQKCGDNEVKSMQVSLNESSREILLESSLS